MNPTVKLWLLRGLAGVSGVGFICLLNPDLSTLRVVLAYIALALMIDCSRWLADNE